MEGIRLPRTMRKYGQVQTSVLISSEFYTLCKENSIKFSEATRVGISLLLAERGIKDYDNNLNITRKMLLLKQKLEETSQQYYDLLDRAKKKGLDIEEPISENNKITTSKVQ